MEVRRGIAVAPGVAIGPALVLGSEDFRIPQRFVRVDAIDIELARFRAALEAAVAEIASHEELAAARLGQQYGAIFGAHAFRCGVLKCTEVAPTRPCQQEIQPETGPRS